jgi:hypothetical protein
MRIVTSAPTRWPAPEVLGAWWRRRVGTAVDRLVERPAAAGLLRTAGTGASPGSRWEAAHPGQRGASGEVLVTGAPADRRLRAAGRLAADPGREAVLDVDGLDVPRRLETRSRLRYLGWDAVLTADPARLLEARLELDWLLVVASAAVRPRGGAEHLEVRLVVRGRGRWRPVLVPVLRSVEGPLQRRTDALVRAAAAAIERVAVQAPPPVPSSRPGSSGGAGSPARPVARAADPQVRGLVRRPGGRGGRLDLSWLASPVGTVRHVRAAARGGLVGTLLDALRGWLRGPPRAP